MIIMSIEKVRSSLNSDDLKTFDDIMYNIHLADDVHHDIIDFNDAKNFIIKSFFDSKPYQNGLVIINNGYVSKTVCY